jgi:hypothetical protein
VVVRYPDYHHLGCDAIQFCTRVPILQGYPLPQLQSRYVFYPKDERPDCSEILFDTCLANCTVSHQRRPKSRNSSLYLSHALWNMLSLVSTTHNPSLLSSVQLHTDKMTMLHFKSVIDVYEQVNVSAFTHNTPVCSYINL